MWTCSLETYYEGGESSFIPIVIVLHHDTRQRWIQNDGIKDDHDPNKR